MIEALPRRIGFRFQNKFRLLFFFLYRFRSFAFVLIVLIDRGVFVLLIAFKLFKVILVLIFIVDFAQLIFKDIIVVQ
ncbi:MAG: hypothetical protein BWY50_02126 [Spirochaetes bacterium ADurb.Bin315]|nr:MAG: hypothetical protein BWY50_02126 [Spirochaetes bacterium ADurb.Bin315]